MEAFRGGWYLDKLMRRRTKKEQRKNFEEGKYLESSKEMEENIWEKSLIYLIWKWEQKKKRRKTLEKKIFRFKNIWRKKGKYLARKNRRGRRTKKVNRNFIRYQSLLFIIFPVYFPCHSLRGNIYFLIHIFRIYLSVGNNSHHFPYFCVINSRYQFLQIVCCHGLHLRDKDQLLKHPLAVSRIFFLFNFFLKVWLLIESQMHIFSKIWCPLLAPKVLLEDPWPMMTIQPIQFHPIPS